MTSRIASTHVGNFFQRGGSITGWQPNGCLSRLAMGVPLLVRPFGFYEDKFSSLSFVPDSSTEVEFSWVADRQMELTSRKILKWSHFSQLASGDAIGV